MNIRVLALFTISIGMTACGPGVECAIDTDCRDISRICVQNACVPRGTVPDGGGGGTDAGPRDAGARDASTSDACR
jgi:hypothetical protein